MSDWVVPDGTKRTLSGKELIRWRYRRCMQDYLAYVQGMDDRVEQLPSFKEGVST